MKSLIVERRGTSVNKQGNIDGGISNSREEVEIDGVNSSEKDSVLGHGDGNLKDTFFEELLKHLDPEMKKLRPRDTTGPEAIRNAVSCQVCFPDQLLLFFLL